MDAEFAADNTGQRQRDVYARMDENTENNR